MIYCGEFNTDINCASCHGTGGKGDGPIAEVFAMFDHVIESSKAGVRKPEPRIYEMMLERLALPASAASWR